MGVVQCYQGCNEVRWRPGQEASLAPSCSKQVFRKQMHRIKRSTCDIIGAFRRPPHWFGVSLSDSVPAELCPLSPLVTPLQSFDNRAIVSATLVKQSWSARAEYFKIHEAEAPGAEEGARGHNGPGRITGGAETSQQCRKYFLQYSTFTVYSIVSRPWL